jgi:hypothetical protein
MDPDYLAKYESLISARNMESGSHQPTQASMNVSNTTDVAMHAISAPAISVPALGDEAATQTERAEANTSVDDSGSHRPIPVGDFSRNHAKPLLINQRAISVHV